ncbi:MAG: GNAT family N-acetyltransferase [Phycisphaerae bacterium]|nr:GNAT family N-acetyltransferase [Phycisphaerae bacterium]
MTTRADAGIIDEAPSRDGADRAFALADGGARCSLWWSSTPRWRDASTGCIGHFEARDLSSATTLLRQAAKTLFAAGIVHCLGPLDGSTWRRYRAVIETSVEPVFAMEPTSPAWWPEAFRGAGFTVAETYHSSLEDPITIDDRIETLARRVRDAGITLVSIDELDDETALDAVFAISRVGFADNALYTPLARAEFDAMYRPLMGRQPHGLALLARGADDAPLGFLFGLPNLVEPQPCTLILKSMAIMPSARRVGLGTLLIERCKENARTLGLARCIYALMHDANHSATIARHHAAVIRRYALFARSRGS